MRESRLLHLGLHLVEGGLSLLATYQTADESEVAEVAANQTTFSTNEGLVAPGATALFRVYVVLTTANERGSNTVGVTRPG